MGRQYGLPADCFRHACEDRDHSRAEPPAASSKCPSVEQRMPQVMKCAKLGAGDIHGAGDVRVGPKGPMRLQLGGLQSLSNERGDWVNG